MGAPAPFFMAIDQVLLDELGFINFFTYYSGADHQVDGVKQLYHHIKESNPTLLAQNADWVETYRDGSDKLIDILDDKPGYVTSQMMSQLTGYPPNSFDAVFCDDCNRLFNDTGFIKHVDAMRMLMANMMHETCQFVYLKELADGRAYEGRSDLGNTQPGDGPRFKGAGVLQLTGRYNYQRLADGVGDQRVMEGVDYVADTYPFTSARVWIEENDLLNVCLNQGFDACCVRINGGWNGYDDRKTKYAVCQRVMK